MAAIEVENLVKQYGKRTALDGVSFSIEEGETFGYLGPNGAGKTTTIRILTGMTQATSGTARILSHDIRSDTIRAKRYLGAPRQIGCSTCSTCPTGKTTRCGGSQKG